MTEAVDEQLREHLLRADGQEDLCFALYRPSTGATRDTGVIFEVILPRPGDRHVHGNASFSGGYLLRAVARAADADAGLALLHAHPRASTWQHLSHDDRKAEAGHAISVLTMTGLPLLGLTLSGASLVYSARFWPDRHSSDPDPEWASTVRIVGPGLRVCYNPDLNPPPPTNPKLARTTHAWGRDVQADLARLRVGIIGSGSVAQPVGEALVRTGIAKIKTMDFDSVEEHNLDRLLFATQEDIGASKSRLLARWLRRHSIADTPEVTSSEYSVVEPSGWADALDCDVLFSCVDRPWPRYALNIAAYVHMIPVIDGGVSVDVDETGCIGAEWRAHFCAPGRPCMECLGQYDPADVGMERAGLLDDATYIDGLPTNHRLRRRENVFAFSMACAASEVLELLRAVVAPAGIKDVGALLTHWSTGAIDRDENECRPDCPFATVLLAAGDAAPVEVTGHHAAAEQARAGRETDSQHQANFPERRWHRLRRWWAQSAVQRLTSTSARSSRR